MADHPILFSAPMVHAILRELEKPGTGKTQTRRALDPQPYDFVTDGKRYWNASGVVGGRICINDRDLLDFHKKPAPADRLWVREEHFQFGHWEVDPGKMTKGRWEKWRFVPDLPDVVLVPPAEYRSARHAHDPATPAWHKRLGRFMFRKHSRLTLYVTDVRVERLQDISMNDALSEGVVLIPYEELPSADSRSSCWYGVPRNDGGYSHETPHPAWTYGHLWDAINGPGAWEANPWVVAYTFTPHLGNIDTLPATLQEAA